MRFHHPTAIDSWWAGLKLFISVQVCWYWSPKSWITPICFPSRKHGLYPQSKIAFSCELFVQISVAGSLKRGRRHARPKIRNRCKSPHRRMWMRSAHQERVALLNSWAASTKAYWRKLLASQKGKPQSNASQLWVSSRYPKLFLISKTPQDQISSLKLTTVGILRTEDNQSAL